MASGGEQGDRHLVSGPIPAPERSPEAFGAQLVPLTGTPGSECVPGPAVVPVEHRPRRVHRGAGAGLGSCGTPGRQEKANHAACAGATLGAAWAPAGPARLTAMAGRLLAGPHGPVVRRLPAAVSAARRRCHGRSTGTRTERITATIMRWLVMRHTSGESGRQRHNWSRPAASARSTASNLSVTSIRCNRLSAGGTGSPETRIL